MMRGVAVGVEMKAVTDYIGITDQQLRTEMQPGKSLADVAVAHGKTCDGLKAALTAATKTRLDTAVKNGKLTQAQADAVLTKFNANLDQMVDRKPVQKQQRQQTKPNKQAPAPATTPTATPNS
jgi:hypothetical protein